MSVTLAEDTIVGVAAVLQPGRVFRDGDLSIAVLRFNYELDGVRQTYNGAVGQGITNNSWNYIYLDYDGSLNINTTGFPTTTHIRLAKVRADSGAITNITDERVLLAAGIDKEINYIKSEGQSSNTSTWQEKVSLSLPSIPEGTYLIQWYAEIRHSNNTLSEYAAMRVQVNDLTEIGYSIWPYNGWEDAGGMNVYDIGAGSHTVDLDFEVSGGGTAYIRRARLVVWRIA